LSAAAQSPARRAWRRFRANRLGYVSLTILAVAFCISLLGEVLSNDRPLVVKYEGHWYFPVAQTLPETTFGGDFPTPTDYLDPAIRDNLAKPGNFVLFPPNRYHYNTINYFARDPAPAAPSRELSGHASSPVGVRAGGARPAERAFGSSPRQKCLLSTMK